MINDLTEQRVRAILARHFPKLQAERVVRVCEGGDHATFEVEGRLILRFPKERVTETKLEREVALLPVIGPLLPLPVPIVAYHGRPVDLYPYAFAGYHKLSGISGEVLRPDRRQWPALACQVEAFLSCLHAFSSDEARRVGLVDDPLPEPGRLLDLVTRYRDQIAEAFPAVLGVAEAYLSAVVPLPPLATSPLVVSHADLKGEHVLVSPRGDAIAGIIDWTDVALCDPVLDFTGLMIWLGESFVRQVLSHYTRATAEPFLDHVRFYARCFSLEQLGLRLTDQSDAPLPLLLTQLSWAFGQGFSQAREM